MRNVGSGGSGGGITTSSSSTSLAGTTLAPRRIAAAAASTASAVAPGTAAALRVVGSSSPIAVISEGGSTPRRGSGSGGASEAGIAGVGVALGKRDSPSALAAGQLQASGGSLQPSSLPSAAPLGAIGGQSFGAMRSIFAPPRAAGAGTTEANAALRRNLLLAAAGCIMLGIFVLPSLIGSTGSTPGAKVSSPGGVRGPISLPTTFRIAIIADLDKRSARTVNKKTEWHTVYKTGTMSRSGTAYRVDWDADKELSTSHNEAGRGCELSELVLYNRKLLSFDDRTGIMFELINYDTSQPQDDAPQPMLVPRQLYMEGDGVTDKGLKIEWATVRGDLLYVGSFGKEFTDDGRIVHRNNLWVKVMTGDGVIKHVDWTPYYNRLREELGYTHPGYLLHEAITWSPVKSKWYVLPRRMSLDPYSEEVDEERGANTIIEASPDFSVIKATTVGKLTPTRGFSSFKFLPGSGDTVIVALKSEEVARNDSQRTFITVYGEESDGRWKVLMDERLIPGDYKFEGLEVIGWS